MRAIEREELLGLCDRSQSGRPPLTAAERARLAVLLAADEAEQRAAEANPGPRPFRYGGDYSDL